MVTFIKKKLINFINSLIMMFTVGNETSPVFFCAFSGDAVSVTPQRSSVNQQGRL
jgi:hypothetical protein